MVGLRFAKSVTTTKNWVSLMIYEKYNVYGGNGKLIDNATMWFAAPSNGLEFRYHLIKMMGYPTNIKVRKIKGSAFISHNSSDSIEYTRYWKKEWEKLKKEGKI